MVTARGQAEGLNGPFDVPQGQTADIRRSRPEPAGDSLMNVGGENCHESAMVVDHGNFPRSLRVDRSEQTVCR
jgi:hypothetical protein